MVGGFLERREHQHAVLHFSYTKTGDPKDFALQEGRQKSERTSR
jgi:hypothetical protein